MIRSLHAFIVSLMDAMHTALGYSVSLDHHNKILGVESCEV